MEGTQQIDDYTKYAYSFYIDLLMFIVTWSYMYTTNWFSGHRSQLNRHISILKILKTFISLNSTKAIWKEKWISCGMDDHTKGMEFIFKLMVNKDRFAWN